jgi:amino acid adenylation domain-containing protein
MQLPKLSEADSIALKQRLAGLSADQRALLVRRLGEEKSEAASSSEAHAIPRARPLRVEEHPRVAVYPASHGQQRMWFLHHYAPESPVYCVPSAFHLAGSLNVAWLEAAFSAVIQRHDMLRTTFSMENGTLFQGVASHSAFQLQQLNLETTPADVRRAGAERCIEEAACLPFDLTSGPPFRAVLVRLQPTEHVLLLVLHHIIADGWSRSNFYCELSAAYEALATGRGPKRELPVQFADYSAWQKDWLESGALEAQTTYWKTKLAGEPEPLDLPSDRARPATESFRGGRCSRRLDSRLTAALQTRAQEEGATLFMILLAAFKTLLHRYTGHDDLIVGVPIANRQHVQVEGLIGFFANTLVMRTTFASDLTFRELLRRVKQTAVEAYSNQDIPFERLVELLHVRRDASRTPLFQASFALQDYPEVQFLLPGLQTSPWFVTTRTSKFDFGMAVERSVDGWTATVEYSTDLFDADRVERMLEHWRVILENAVAKPAQRVAEIPLLTAAEVDRLLVEWNRTERDYPRDKCVHHLFEEQVERTPEAVAVVFGVQSLTYRDLNVKANRLAHHLRSLGVGPGELVGLRVERSFEMVIGLLGILKAGGAYWALEENLPEERLRLLLADARPRVLLVRRTSSDSTAAIGPIAVIEDLLESSPQATVSAAPASQAVDPAYVNYTSGSSGQPKGVLVPHRGVARLVKGADYVSLTEDETLLHLSPLSFDASTFELWGALLNGGRVVLLSPGQPSLGEIGEAIRQHGVTTLWLTASLFHLMVDERLNDLKPLRQLLAGGDVLSPQHVLKAHRALPGCRIINGYGPTENTTFTCCYTVADERALAPSVPIGRPIANTRVYVLDASLQPVPVGVPGELYAGGDGVACGYLNQPQLTAERFIPDPFNSRAGARLYRTGDLVRWRPDGNLEFLRRLDSQVKIRGFRVELGEIETVLREAVGVREAVVSLREDAVGEKQLVAYVVASGNKGPDEPGLKAALKAKLSDYMIPVHVEFLSTLPLTPSGKVDRRALPKPTLAAAGSSGEMMPSRNLLELELIRLWRRLFQREGIGRQDNFFDLGGHSLLAARLAAEIDKLLGCKLPIEALFQSPTVESLTRRLTEENWAPPWNSLVPLQPQGAKPPFFFVHGWGGDVYGFLGLAQLLAPDQPAYGIQAVGLDGRSARHTTIENMAAHYVQEIRSFQPEGPYCLGGYSMGGLIAFEMAQQLHRLGQRVALLVLFDTMPICLIPWTVYGRAMASYLPGRCVFHLRRSWEMPSRDRLDYFRGRWAALQFWIARNRSKPAVVTAPPPKDSHPPQVPGFADYYHALASAYRLYRYPGSADIFVSDDAKPQWVSFWRHLVRGGVSFHRVPGTHLQLLTPGFLPVLAKALRTALERAQQNANFHPKAGNSHASPAS